MKLHAHFFPLLVFTVSTSLAETVEIGTNSIPLSFPAEETRIFDTNRVACEFTKYFAAGDAVETFFGTGTGSLTDGQSVQMDPGPFETGLPVDVAENIVYFAPPNARIVIGATALTWILGQFELSLPLTNVWNQIDSLFIELADGSITNNLVRCRETFVVNGTVWTNATTDVEMLRGIQTHWSVIQFLSPSVFGLRRGSLIEGGPETTGLHCRYSKPGQSPWETPSHCLIYLDGRWRIVLP